MGVGSSEGGRHAALFSEEVYDHVEPPGRAGAGEEVPLLVRGAPAEMDGRTLDGA